MKILSGILSIFVFIFMSVGAAQNKLSEAAPTEKSKSNKMEELFIWKISDELKLSTSEEKKFADLFKDLNKKKAGLLRQQDEIINQLSKASVKAQKDLLKSYRRLLEDQNKLSTSEFDSMKKQLGDERLAKYFVVKRDLTNKVKLLLTDKSEKKDSQLPPPKVIEE